MSKSKHDDGIDLFASSLPGCIAKIKYSGDDERYCHMQMQMHMRALNHNHNRTPVPALPIVAPRNHVSEYQAQCHAFFESQAAYQAPGMFHPLPSQPKPTFLPRVVPSALPVIRSSAVRAIFTMGISLPASSCSNAPLKTGKRAHANRCVCSAWEAPLWRNPI